MDYRYNGFNLLVVDDDETLLKFFKIHFNTQFDNVTACTSGTDAWNQFKQGQYDMVITDIMMPRLNGTDFIKKVRKKSPATTIIAISGGSLEETEIAEIKKFAEYFVTKPFNLDEIHEKVTYCLQKHMLLAQFAKKYRTKKEFLGKVLKKETLEQLAEELDVAVPDVADRLAQLQNEAS